MGIQRGLDSTGNYGGIPYVFGYQENKVHGTLEASWQNQYVTPMGVVATPYLGLRGDYASYDGASPLNPVPVSLLSATPIAAVDVRFPMIATNGLDSHLFEPIAQLVYRGSSTTLPGIINDNAQSFVFDDTNLFSYDRFSGSDRQETGLRANVGGRYMANFDDGRWLELIGGQSYHIAGVNSLGVADHAQTGNSTGLGNTASYIVLGAQGAPLPGVRVGGKVQLDPGSFKVMRAGVGGEAAYERLTFGLDYFYLAANPATGTLADQHEVTARATAPLPIDYWSVDGSLSWDLGAQQFLAATGGVTYDDGYFVGGGFVGINGATHTSPNAVTYGLRLLLRTPTTSFSPLSF
jgi:LPS-assembly protein